MSELGQPLPDKEVELPPADLKETVTRLHKSFKDAFKKSRELPLWHLAFSGGSLGGYSLEYVTEKKRWRVSDGSDSFSIHTDISTENGIETEEIELWNDESLTWLLYRKFTPDEKDHDRREVFYARDSPLAVELMEKMISELPKWAANTKADL